MLDCDATSPLEVGVSVGGAMVEDVLVAVFPALVKAGLPVAVGGGGGWGGGAWETGALDSIIVLLLVTEREERLITFDDATEEEREDPGACCDELVPNAPLPPLPLLDKPIW